jgi:hypothetical protein
MKRVLFVSLLFFYVSPLWATSRVPPDCNLQRLASLKIIVADQILVPVDYRGQTVWMVLDLAQPMSLLSPGAVAPLKLTTRNIEARPDEFMLKIDGKSVTATADIDSLKMGNYRLSRRSFFVDPRPSPVDPMPDRVVLGTLGMRDLWPVDFELDLVHRQLNLYSPDHCAGAVSKAWGRSMQIPMELNEFGNVVFPIEVDGTKVVASISTSSPGTYMSLDVSRQIFGFDEQSPDVQLRVDAEHHRRVYYRLMSLVAGDLRLPNVEIWLVPRRSLCTLSKTGLFGNVWEYQGRYDHVCFGVFPLVLGRQTIEHLHLYFATKEKTIYFGAAEQMFEQTASR